MSESATTFREAYAVLKANAEQLRSQREPNIDDLLEIVTRSVDAYKVCQSRIEAVEQALARTLASASTSPGTETREDADGAATDAGDDDVPF